MAAPAEATPLELAFDKLNTCVKNQQHKKALKACDESEIHGDLDRLHRGVNAPPCKHALRVMQKRVLAMLDARVAPGVVLAR